MSDMNIFGLRRALPLALSLLCALPLSGCGGGGSNGGSSSSPSPAPATPAAPLSASAVTPSGLTATLAENTATVASGGNVTYTLTLINNTGQPITFLDYLKTDGSGTLPGGISEITDVQGTVVYPNPFGGPTGEPALPTTTFTLSPHQSLSQILTQPFPYQAGRYTVTAYFQALLNSTASLGSTMVTLNVTVQ